VLISILVAAVPAAVSKPVECGYVTNVSHDMLDYLLVFAVMSVYICQHEKIV